MDKKNYLLNLMYDMPDDVFFSFVSSYLEKKFSPDSFYDVQNLLIELYEIYKSEVKK